MQKDTSVVVLEEVKPLVEKVQSLSISTEKDMQVASEALSQLNTISDRIEEEKGKVLIPLNEAVKAERARWKPIETLYEGAIASIRSKMSAYMTAEANRVKEEEAKIAMKAVAGSLTLKTAQKKIDAIEHAEEKVVTTSGMVKFRDTPTLKIVDESKIPREYLVVDEKKVMADLKAGKVVPGAVIEIIKTPINFR